MLETIKVLGESFEVGSLLGSLRSHMEEGAWYGDKTYPIFPASMRGPRLAKQQIRSVLRPLCMESRDGICVIGASQYGEGKLLQVREARRIAYKW